MPKSRSVLAHHKAGVATIATIAALMSAPAAHAQAQSAPSADDGNIIIVTARFEAENIQDVPLPITAFDSEAIERRNITELDDVARFTAGFSFEDFDGGNANPAIRGQSTLRASAREQTVAAFLDGVYLPRSFVVDLGTSNLERIEVVKGPQSSRYGRNAFAGAINYVSARPGDILEAQGEVTLGNYDRFEISGSIAVPLVGDRLGVILTGEHTEFDGSWRNDHPNANAGISPGTPGRIGGWDNQAFSGMVVAKPTDQIEIEVAYHRYDKSEEGRAARWLNTGLGQGNCGALQGSPPDQEFSLFCGVYPATGDTASLDPRGFGRQADINVFRASLLVEPTDALSVFYQFGNINASSASANTAEADTVNCGTILGPPNFPALCNFQGSPFGDINYSQHELRLTYNDGGAVRGSVGAFYLDGLDENRAVSINLAQLGTDPIDIQPFSFGGFTNFLFRDEESTTEVYSVFGELVFAFNEDRTRISAEGRYTEEQIVTFNKRTSPPTQIGEDTFKFFTPRFTLEHEASPDTLLYATVARGAKAGGFNAGAITPELESFDPEFNWTYEVGAKNTLLNGDMTLNLAAFFTDWSALQINVTEPLGGPFTPALTDNLGDARIWGAEIEGAWRASDNLSFDFAGSYTNARYKAGTVDEQFTRGFAIGGFPAPCDDTVCNSNGDIGGNSLERSPEWQLALGTMWEGELSQGIDYFIRGDVSYQSDFFANQINSAIIPDRTVVHARAGITYNETIKLSIWARNLLDETYVSNSLAIIQPFSNNILGTYFGERRTVGATLGFGF